MKKLLLLLMVLMPTICMAQDDMYGHITVPQAKISIDKLEKNGDRLIQSKFHNFSSYFSRNFIHYSIKGVKSGNTIKYYLTLKLTSRLPLGISKGMVMYIKTGEGNVLEFECANGDFDETGNVDCYSIIVDYDITSHQMWQIGQEGLMKIRLQMEGRDFYDTTYKSKLAGKYLTNCFDLVASEMKKPKSFTDGF